MHQSASFKHVDVLHNGGERHREELPKLEHRYVPVREPLDHPAPVGGGERAVYLVELMIEHWAS
jgi:hypothetical protein